MFPLKVHKSCPDMQLLKSEAGYSVQGECHARCPGYPTGQATGDSSAAWQLGYQGSAFGAQVGSDYGPSTGQQTVPSRKAYSSCW
ncbi:hypothetical protein B0H67DRAFT_287030 [Lasiosphaeris hirsuta]|uniref:Uncharacterized protein n=1 Tax=Lasiosphaeris hirsuta TaxID=260670 RepID=A0AA40A8Q6_9PEZI|nr:hypothetical protein B0H67DRAFT_287030 [Lasiosphaeris hirsuta]